MFKIIRKYLRFYSCAQAQSLSHIKLCDPATVVCHVPLPMGFSRQECGDGLHFPPPEDLSMSSALAGRLFTTRPPGKLLRFMYVCQLLSHVLLCATPWTIAHQASLSTGFPCKNTGVGCHALFQGIFPTQGLNLGLLH